MTSEQIAELVKRLRDRSSEAEKFTLMVSGQQRADWQSISALYGRAADAIESLQASVANAEARYDASEARNEFLTGVIEAIEQAAKEAKELPK